MFRFHIALKISTKIIFGKNRYLISLIFDIFLKAFQVNFLKLFFRNVITILLLVRKATFSLRPTLNRRFLRSCITVCTRLKITLLLSNTLMYVAALQSLTHVIAPASIIDLFDEPCCCRDLLMASMNAFFLRCLGLQGAP